MERMVLPDSNADIPEIDPHLVLIVEDDEPLSQLLQKRLRRAGYTPDIVATGKAALEKINSNPPGLMLLDYSLPDMTGREIIEAMNGHRSRVPFIAMTGFRDHKIVLDMMKLGARDYLIKDADFLELIPRVVNQVVDQLQSEAKLAQAESKLRESEKRYRTLFERNVVGNFHTQIDGRFIDCNEAFAQICGYKSREEILSLNASELYLNADDREGYIEKLQSDKKLLNYELSLKRKDGKQAWILESVVLLEGENGDNPTIQGTLIDISERKATEKALKASEELNRGIVTTAPIGIIYLDRVGNILYENPVMREILGDYENSQSQVGLRNIKELPNMTEVGGEKIVNRLLTGERIEGEQVKYRINQNIEKILQVYGAPRRGSNKEIVGAVFMALDISDLRTLEEQFLQSQKMEAVGRLAGGIAHDFNNLLMAITGHTELTLMKLGKEDPTRNALVEIKKASDRAASLTRQLLAFSRKQVLEPKIIDTNTIITNMDRMLRRIIGEDVKLVTHIDPEIWSVKVDPGQIEQVLLNLAVNARDAMPQGGQLTIETTNTVISEEFIWSDPELKPGSYVLIKVTDNGIGMSEEVKSRIFEPFYTTKELGKGTGLGLSTVYGIIKQSGGYVRVRSELGRGSTFLVYLPRVIGDPDIMDEMVGLENLPRGNETILVVEDEEVVRQITGRVLKRQGYNVLEANSGSDAYMICQRLEKPVDLVITDVVMPNMGGAEFIKRLWALWSSVKVVYMSGYTEDSMIHNGAIRPGTPYLQKPFNLATLVTKVREVLDG